MLNTDDLSYMRGCLDDIATDTEEPIIYRQFTGITSGDQAMGIPDRPGFTDLAITALIRELTLEEVRLSGGAYILGDVEFRIRQAVLEIQPIHLDRIICGGASYKPKSISHSFLGGIIDWKVRAGRE